MKAVGGGFASMSASALLAVLVNYWVIPFQHWNESFELQADGRWYGGIEGTHLRFDRLPADIVSRARPGDKLVWNYSLTAYLIPIRYDRYRIYRAGMLIGGSSENMGAYFLTLAGLGSLPGLFLWLVLSRHAKESRPPAGMNP